MVNWSGAGNFAGYDPATNTLKEGVYKFASAGTVDVNAITRLERSLAGVSNTNKTYFNATRADATITFTGADISNNPGRRLTVAQFIAPASLFPEGKVPTPSEILAVPRDQLWVTGSDWYWNSIVGSATRKFTMPGFGVSSESSAWPSGKCWVLVIPITIPNTATKPTSDNWRQMRNTSANSIGRALSFWPNRTPEAPVITAPISGTVVQPGDTFALTFAPKDPDRVTPADAKKYSEDLAGVQIQYAPLPTDEDPTPDWLPLPFHTPGYADQTIAYNTTVFRGDGGVRGEAPMQAILDNLGVSVLVGADTIPAGVAALPGGDWQIRVRTFDFAHPYPKSFAPLGLKYTTDSVYNAERYPIWNTSPWSSPVRISVPVQVPPPLALSPKDSIAVQEGQTVRLTWQYRNTYLPPFDQRQREVQIRRVGDQQWSTVFGGVSGNPYVDLPPVLDNPPPLPPTQHMSDGGFEAGTLSGWTGVFPTDPGFVGGVLTNETGAPPASHAGTHHLKSIDPADPLTDFSTSYAFYDLSLAETDQTATFSGWIAPPAVNPDRATLLMVLSIWMDDENNEIPNVGNEISGATFYRGGDGAPGGVWDTDWHQFNYTITRPDNATRLVTYLASSTDYQSGERAEFRLDDISLTTDDFYDLDDFTLEATTWYEWRVRVQDEDLQWSNFSTPARFWVVPAGNSGSVRPVPTQTVAGATLGCGTHRVFVYRRGGIEPVGEITSLSHVDWERVRDDISTSKVIVSGWDIDCGNLLAKLQCWAYEIVIFRDNGYSVDRVWEGPITLLTYETDKVTIQAKDVMGYAYRRIIRQRMNDTGNSPTAGDTVTRRAGRVLRNAFAPDDPNVLAYLNIIEREDDAKQYRSTPSYARTAFEEVDDMAANAGLDYTCVGRSILVWDTSHRIGTLPEFKDSDLGAPPIVSEYGMSMANVYSVSDGNGVHGEATRLDENGEDPIYGLVEMLSSTWASDSPADTGTYTQEGLQTVIESFKASAERSIADRYPPPVVVRVPDNTSLNPDTVLSIQQLVPGVLIPLRSMGTLRTVVASQKLDAVRVSEENGTESIQITLSPFSRDDASIGEGVEQ